MTAARTLTDADVEARILAKGRRAMPHRASSLASARSQGKIPIRE